MKIQYLEEEKLQSGRKPKSPKINHGLISRVGKTIYHMDNVKEVSIKVKLQGGTSISFNRSENEDRLDNIRREIDEEDEDD